MFSSPWPKRLFLSLSFLLALQAGLQAQTLRTAGDRPIDIQHLRLDLRIDIPQKTVDAKATINATALRSLPSFSLDAVGFKVKEVRRAEPGGNPAVVHFSQDAKKLTIDCAPVWNSGEKATYEIDYLVKNPQNGLHFYSPNSSEPDVPSMVYSQGETEENRYWIPCLDHPNVRQTTEMFVTVAPGYDVLSNGKLVDKQENPADKTVTFHWLQDKCHPSYLITLVVGQFDIVETSWEGIPVSYWVPKGHKETIEPTFGRTPEMIAFFSKRFGVRYPWDKYAQVVVEQFTFGGMENTSATTMTQFILVDKRSLLDGNADSVVSHELAHQWWGDLLTCRDWAHTWLNEGWASFAEVLWDEHSLGKDEADWNLVLKGQGARSRFGNGGKPIVDRHYANPDSMFDTRVYPKGAWVLHMLCRQMGEEAFWKGVKHYAEKNRLQSVETSDFRRALEETSGQDLERFFYDWTERGGSPTLEVQTTYDADHKQLKLVVKQTQKEDPFHLPLKVAFHLPGDAKPVTVEKSLTERESTFMIPLTAGPDFFEVDPNQDILAEIKETQPVKAWLALLKHGANVASRVRAARHLGGVKDDKPLVTDELVVALKAEPFWGVQQEIARALGSLGGPKAKEAFLANSESDKPRLRRICIDELARFKTDPEVVKLLRTILEKGDPSYAVEAAALRAFDPVSVKDAVKLYTPWLDKASPNDSLRRAAVDGLVKTKDKAA
ncbi:MAG TPA: M1 family aminopeptidase, partial [Gemmataceae bacterium]|nr:M1 family aminopeptidase [Gemmataceae bacterium]